MKTEHLLKSKLLMEDALVQDASSGQIIRDCIPFKLVRQPETITEDTKNGGKRKYTRLTGLVQKADDPNENERVYPLNVMKEAVGAIQEAISARMVLGELDHPCLTTDDFRVLTVDGWKEFKDIKVGDKVYSRVDGVMVESEVKNVINDIYKGKVYNLKGRHIDVQLTAPHKIIMDTKPDTNHISKQMQTTVKEIFDNRHIYNKCKIPRAAEWNGVDDQKFVIPGVLEKVDVARYKEDITQNLIMDTKAFVSLLGFYLAEGYLSSGSSYDIVLSQKKEDYKKEIKNMLLSTGLGWKKNDRGWVVSDRRLYEYLEKLGDKYSKYIPDEIKKLDAKYLQELVYWHQVGDDREKHNRSNVFSVSKKLIEDLHECWVKIGGCCYSTETIVENDCQFCDHIIEAKNKSPLYQLTLSHADDIYLDDRFLGITEENYDGKIYCLTTEHGNFYIEHKGYSYWTGNCDAKVHTENACILLTKLWMERKDVFAQFEILEGLPKGQMLKALIDQGVTISISSRGVGDMEAELMEDGSEINKVCPGFRFVCFDAVNEPSVRGTALSVMESRQRRIVVKENKVIKEKELITTFSKYLYGR